MELKVCKYYYGTGYVIFEPVRVAGGLEIYLKLRME